ncbi:inorganic phosphate transporter, PiT family [Pseudonocardia thermophila]|uniref:Phosphate transporter n=1 Tax=Pseudonocardia thermophila TaxID=1848 RepID=A0A1M6V239_PSETH|nr:inorganic phosphate transporter [Pseudonocardia thermophila]SHK75435.1 inorganic phosphate transporter, PiT family [Pseudonocardia thermophila]
MDVSLIVVLVIGTALAFDFTNGFHDTANAMAASIATGALRPRTAVTNSAVLNLAGAFLSVEVAATISGGLVDDAAITPEVVFAGLVGAIVWNLVTWLVGMPSSSSHALFGGLIGAAWTAAGAGAVHLGGLVGKVLLPAAISPLIAGGLAFAGTAAVYRASGRRNARRYRAGQVLAAALLSLAHGTNDAQKTMGVVTLALITAGVLAPGSPPPFWVILAAGLAIAAGTYSGGWRIIHTLGRRVSTVEPPQGFAADTTSATVILTSSWFGLPLSTTQVCSGSIVGAAAGRKSADVQWRIAGHMVVAWFVTLPAAALVGATAAWCASVTGPWVVAAAGALVVAGIIAASRRRPVTAETVAPQQVRTLPSPPDEPTDRIAA